MSSQSSVKLSILAAVALLSASCGAAMSGGGRDVSVFRMDLPRATPNDIARHTREIFNRFQYDIERADDSPYSMMFESRWTGRYPLPDEQARGVTAVRTRVIVRAGPVQSGTGLARAQFIGETMVRIEGAEDWQRTLLTEQARAQFERVAEELKMELETGIRIR